MPTQNISTKKFHPVRYYVVEREDAQILISHATVSCLDLVRVLCTNKVPKCKRQVASVTKKLKEPPHNNSHFRTSTPSQREIFSDRTATPSQREILSGTAHNNKIDTEKSTRAEEATSTSHTAMGGNDTGTRKLTGRKTGQRSIQLYSSKHLHPTASQLGRCKVGQPHRLQDRHTLPKRNILSVQQVTITVSKLISGPLHPPKVKYPTKHQNACTTSHRKTRKLTPSMLRAISSATKTPTRLLKPLHLRTCLAAGSTLSIINLARLPLTVLKT